MLLNRKPRYVEARGSMLGLMDFVTGKRTSSELPLIDWQVIPGKKQSDAQNCKK